MGVLGLGLLVFSCGGEEFGAADPQEPDAGASSIGEGGDDVGAGGSKVTPPSGGRSGAAPSGGTESDPAGAPGVSGSAGTGGTTGSGGSDDPGDCSDVVAPELPGDCKKVVCSMGNLVDQVDSSDTPEPRGPCDVPKCEGGLPSFGSDPAQCHINQVCGDGQCTCAACPNGKVAALSGTLCRLPAGVVVSASGSLAGSGPARVADGNPDTTWNSGSGAATLTVTPASPQPMTAVALWLSGSADNSTPPDKKYILVHVSVEPASGGPAIMKSGNFNFADVSTGPLRLDLGLVNAKKLTFTFESPSTWIAVHEVVFEICAG
jgi:hypothetical protein